MKTRVLNSDSGLRGLTRQVRDLAIEDIRFANDGKTILIQLEDDVEIEINKSNEWDISLNH